MKKETKIQRAVDLLKSYGFFVIPPPTTMEIVGVKNKPDPLVGMLDGYPLAEVMAVWLEYKKEKKQNYTARGLKVAMRKLLDYSNGDKETAMQIIENSMANNYAGFFQLNPHQTNGKLTKQEAASRVAKSAAQGNTAMARTISDCY